MIIKHLLLTMRPKQWYKNLVIFIALIFSYNLFDYHKLLYSIYAFLIFCLLSGSVYIVNDIIDRKKDSLHPKKKNRPIASGELGLQSAMISLILILGLSLVSAFKINKEFGYISLTYFFLFILYSFILKNIVIVDILTIAIGFVIRAIAGAMVIGVVFSSWLVICTFSIAMFLGLGKRRHEIILLGDDAKNHRKILKEYSTEVLDQMLTIATGFSIISYSMYTFLADHYYMMITIPIMVYGTFRYLFLVHNRNIGGEPEMLFKDKGIIVSIVLWGFIVIGILYLK